MSSSLLRIRLLVRFSNLNINLKATLIIKVQISAFTVTVSLSAVSVFTIVCRKKIFFRVEETLMELKSC
jgi:hypothetical protein